MKWKIKNMVDPGDGIVTETTVDHQSDDICEVASDAYNGEIQDSEGENITFNGWIMSVEALPS